MTDERQTPAESRKKPGAGPAGATTRRGRVLRRIAAFGVLLVCVPGPTSAVVPPFEPEDPVVALLICDGLHRGLALPRPEGGYVEYGFGDWNWYAENRQGAFDGCAAVLWPTPGALGRRELPASVSAVRGAIPDGSIRELPVARADAERLRERLEGAMRAGAAAARVRDDLRTTFVPCDASYWFGRNCADATADWLRELGCRVDDAPVRTRFVVQDAAGPR